MKKGLFLLSIFLWLFLCNACATQQRRRLAEPLMRAPRDVTIIYFAFNKSDLTEQARHTLEQAAKRLKKHAHWIAHLEGHADAIGAFPYNLKLGDKRARSVKEFMVLSGVDPDQLIILSFGEEQPIASNQDDKGRQQNRRVEIRLR